jgi:hypothetical protein
MLRSSPIAWIRHAIKIRQIKTKDTKCIRLDNISYQKEKLQRASIMHMVLAKNN